MELYVIRHAEAVEASAYIEEQNRYLTEEGKKEAERMGRFLKKVEAGFSILLTSPLVRAVDTAKLLVKFSGLEDKCKIEICQLLSPKVPFNDLIKELKKHEQNKRIAILGHQPDMGRFISRLCFQSEFEGINLKRCAVAFIEEVVLEKTPSGKLRWIVEPNLLERK